MSRSRKVTIAIVAIAVVASALAFTSPGHGVLKKIYVAVACEGDCS